MASKNPFGQLQVRRDEEDEQTVQRPTGAQIPTSTPLFSQPAAAEKKKKKVRPDEKKKSEEVREENDEEGFSVVGQKKKPAPRHRNNEEAAPEEKTKQFHLKNKGAFDERNSKVPRGKRQFDRHSGTGRGKEIAKNGAGGKFTWGTNPKNIAKKGDEEYSYDDDVFNRVLNAKPRVPRETKEAEPEVVVEEKPVEETKQVEEQAEVTEAPAEETKDWDKRKKKKGPVEEVNKAELLERPENALSYSEYLEQLKQKNQAIKEAKPKVVAQVENSDLKPQVKNEDNLIGVSSVAAKKDKTKPKQKKEETFLDAAFKLGDDEKRFDNRDNRKQNKKGPKFQFNQEEFPEL